MSIEAKYTPAQSEEIRFWSPQLKEHCLFIYLGLVPIPAIEVDPILTTSKLNGTTLQVPVALQKRTQQYHEVIKRSKDEALTLYKAWVEFEKTIVKGTIDNKTLNDLLNNTQLLKEKLIELQNRQVWIGWLYPDFLKHILKELQFLVRRLRNEVSVDQEAAFWVDVNADHVAFSAHMLDTDEKVRVKVAQALDLADAGNSAIEETSIGFKQMV